MKANAIPWAMEVQFPKRIDREKKLGRWTHVLDETHCGKGKRADADRKPDEGSAVTTPEDTSIAAIGALGPKTPPAQLMCNAR